MKIEEKIFALSKKHLHYGDHFVFYPTGDNDLEIVLRDCLKTHCLSPRQTETKILKVLHPSLVNTCCGHSVAVDIYDGAAITRNSTN